MFWENFVMLCASHNTTPTAVVAALNIAGGSVTKWKNGSAPRDTTIRKVADYFGVSAEDLVSEQKEKQPTQSELSEKQKRLITIIEGMSDDQLDRFEKILAVVESTEQ